MAASYAYAMTRGRDGRRFPASGRDQWVPERRDEAWFAVWPTMLEL